MALLMPRVDSGFILLIVVVVLSGDGLFSRAAESESTISIECQVAGLEYQTAPSCTCPHKLPVCPDGCQVSEPRHMG